MTKESLPSTCAFRGACAFSEERSSDAERVDFGVEEQEAAVKERTTAEKTKGKVLVMDFNGRGSFLLEMNGARDARGEGNPTSR